MKRLLVLNFFPAFVPPSSGGELRYFHLYDHLSKHFDITLLSPTYSHHSAEVVTHSATFREHRIPKEPLHDRLHKETAQARLAEEISALVCSLSARYPNRYHQAYLDLQSSADVIVHESPYMLEYDALLGSDDRPRIYNSYNVEADLVSQMWRGACAASFVAHVTRLNLVWSTRAVFASPLAKARLRDFARSTEFHGATFLSLKTVSRSRNMPPEDRLLMPVLALFFLGAFIRQILPRPNSSSLN